VRIELTWAYTRIALAVRLLDQSVTFQSPVLDYELFQHGFKLELFAKRTCSSLSP